MHKEHNVFFSYSIIIKIVILVGQRIDLASTILSFTKLLADSPYSMKKNLSFIDVKWAVECTPGLFLTKNATLKISQR